MHGEHETVGEREMAGTFEAVMLRPSQAEGQMQGVRRAMAKAPQLRHSACRLQKRDTAKTQCMQTAEKGHSGEILGATGEGRLTA